MKYEIEYKGLKEINGHIIIVESTENISYDEVVTIIGADGEEKTGKVLEVSREYIVIQVFDNTIGLSLKDTRLRFRGKPLMIPVSTSMLGRVFNGLGKPVDGAPLPFSSILRNVNGNPINPFAREYPEDFIQTGISIIDGMNTLVRGQKLPIFSGNGLPHNRLAAQITRQARLLSGDDDFTIIFGAMGIKYDVAKFFLNTFEESRILSRVAMFFSLADAPSIERLITPRSALTLA
ncbi:MAG: V-type ATP synthase subunit B, partial [Actinomycetia bacterium]|nr:V-type ATP synthase subunit B [Actinomycetes bacterium]